VAKVGCNSALFWGYDAVFPVDFTDFSGERTASIFRVKVSKQGNKLTARSTLLVSEDNIKDYI
jgi:hypothetical protein